MKVILNDKEGLVPSNYVSKMNDESNQQPAQKKATRPSILSNKTFIPVVKAPKKESPTQNSIISPDTLPPTNPIDNSLFHSSSEETPTPTEIPSEVSKNEINENSNFFFI